MYNCIAIKEILEYSGSISMICKWAQELLGYNFSIIHQSSTMMLDVDTLSRRYGNLIGTHLKYVISFNLAKCIFLSDRVEYVGHDILKDGTTSA